MKRILFLIAFAAITIGAGARQKGLNDEQVKNAMKKATEFMVEKVSNNGGYLWNYSPDFSRQWGELECKPSMMWI
ncbi:MAG: pectate lyase, partial [Bacteroidales bacterium]|nr:pectate lyase [Bacteroidales bacterium]